MHIFTYMHILIIEVNILVLRGEYISNGIKGKYIRRRYVGLILDRWYKVYGY